MKRQARERMPNGRCRVASKCDSAATRLYSASPSPLCIVFAELIIHVIYCPIDIHFVECCYFKYISANEILISRQISLIVLAC